MLEQIRARVRLKHAAAVILAAAVIGFLRAYRLVGGSDAISANPDVRTGLLWMMGLYCLAIGCLAVGLWYWGRELEWERAGSFRLRRLYGFFHGLQDGLLAVNRQGRVLGGNRRARRLAARSVDSGSLLQECFPCLSPDHLAILLDPVGPSEVAASAGDGGDPFTYRFRAFPARQWSLILISDITTLQVEATTRAHQRQLETIGRIAQGVAHDFNNILCAISAHAALLARGKPDAAQAESVATIGAEANRGAILARQLVDLSRPVEQEDPPESLRQTMERAADGLKTVLPPGWEVAADIGPETVLPAMPARHLEQLLVRFGLQLAGAHEVPGMLRLVAGRRTQDPHALQEPDSANTDAAATLHELYLLATPEGTPADLDALAPDPVPPLSRDGGGVIQSVMLALLERYGGALDVLIDPHGRQAYRISLAPASQPASPSPQTGSRQDDLVGRRILLVRPAIGLASETQHLLLAMGADVTRTNNVVGAYSRLGEGTPFQAVFIDELLLGMDPEAALTRILRLQPDAAVVLVRDTDASSYPLTDQVAPLVRPVSRHAIRLALHHASQMALSRSPYTRDRP